MRVELLNREMVDSDLGVVNAARCSFDRESQWLDCHTAQCKLDSRFCEDYHNQRILSEKDKKLIKYLAAHNHWTPFAHSQIVFKIQLDMEELLCFFLSANLSGFEWLGHLYYNEHDRRVMGVLIRGSLYAWLTNSDHFPKDISRSLKRYLYEKYPVSYEAIKGDFINNEHVEHVEEESNGYVSFIDKEDCIAKELNPITLRIHCPIFVKRQLETHRRNLVITDIEDFSQNEVSRRYVDYEPEIYTPTQWRMQSKDKKQGSSQDYLGGIEKFIVDSNYSHSTKNATIYYDAMNNRGVAHEQSRMILPLSTYTTFWWTGSQKSFDRVISLRDRADVQNETRDIAQMMRGCIYGL